MKKNNLAKKSNEMTKKEQNFSFKAPSFDVSEMNQQFKLNSYSLAFPEDLEKDFQRDYFNSSLGLLRISFILGLLYYASFAFLDANVLPEVFKQFFIIRIFIVCPVIMFVLLLTFWKQFQKYWQLSSFLSIMISGIGIIYMMMIAPEMGRYSYYAGLILVMIYSFMLIKMRFIYSTLAGWLLILLYSLSLMFYPELNDKKLLINFFFLISANILGMFGGYALEFYTRKDFYFRHLLKIERDKVAISNTDLEIKVREKTQELHEDIAKRKEIEKALRESEEKYKFLILNSVDVIWQMDAKLRFTYASPSIYQMTGYTQEEWVGSKLSDHSTMKEFFNMARKAVKALKNYKTFKSITFEAVMLKKDGTPFWIEINSKLLFDNKGLPTGLQGATRNITDRKKAEEQIKENLKEKTLLIQELYHRTKNNMQVIASMLKMQSRRSSDEQMQNSYREIINKIHAMSLVHQKLYEAQNLTKINLKEYIEDFVAHLLSSYHVSQSKIELKLALEEVQISIDAAVPLGLILNELISNIFKHAFPEDKAGTIFISLERTGNGDICLELTDNGIGIPVDMDLRNNLSMGLKNVFGLVEHQLRGKIEYFSEEGLRWQIQLRDDNYHKRI